MKISTNSTCTVTLLCKYSWLYIYHVSNGGHVQTSAVRICRFPQSFVSHHRCMIMRSRSNSLEGAVKAEPPRSRRQASEREGACHTHEDTPPAQSKPSRRRAHRERSGAGKSRDLSRDDLVFLLSMLEGELQVKLCQH